MSAGFEKTVPIKIAFCITDLNPGGAEWALVQLVIRLDRNRWEPMVFCLAGAGKLVEVLESAGVPTRCFGVSRWWQVGVVWKLSRALREFRPRLIQTFLFHANLAGRMAGWMAGVKYRVSGIRVAEQRHRTYLWLDRWTERFVTKHVCVSQSVAEFSLRRGRLEPGKVVVIPNGVDVDRFSSATPLDVKELGIEPQANVWLTVGRLDPQKGPWILFDAVLRLNEKHPNLRLLWAGDGPMRQELQDWIVDHNLQSVIRLLGWRDDIPQLLKTVNGFVLASLWEGMPNVVLEALAAGLPTIVTRVEGVEEIIQHGKTGWLTEIGDSQALARIWSEVLENREVRQIASAGQAHVRQKFSWELMASRYERLYQQILENDA